MSYFEDYVEEGLCCVQCGEFMGGDEPGFARLCAGCKRAERYEPRVPVFRQTNIKQPVPGADQIACPDCGKVVKKVGLRHHQLDKHATQTERGL